MTTSKRSLKSMAGGLAVLAALAVGFILLRPGGSPPFRRLDIAPSLQDTLHFTRAPGQGMLFHHSPGGEERPLSVSSDDAGFFEVQGEKTVEFVSPFSGSLQFFCQFHLEGLDGAELRLHFGLPNAAGAPELLLAGRGKRNLRFTRALRLAAGDRIRFTFAGKGIACFSRPLFYRVREPRRRKYVFLIGVDTLRGDHVGMAVNGRSLTPNIDSLQKRAVTFSSCFAQSNWTLPSFMSLFTGQYEFNHQVRHGGVLADGKPFLVRELGRRFITVNLNSGGNVSRNFGFSRAFDHFSSSPRYGDTDGGRILFRDALRLLDTCRFPEAFFFLHTYQVHTPFHPPPEFLRAINPRALTGELNSVTYGSQRKRFMPLAPGSVQSYRELYQAEVLAFDSYLGEFIAALKRRGLYDQSMIIVMSDHGEEFFEHGGWGHGHSMYEELLRVPLVVRFPSDEFAGRRVDEPAGIIDILPTLLDFYGIADASREVDGVSLLPLLRGGRLAREHLYSSVSTCWYIRQLPARFAVIDGKHKIIFNYDYRDQALAFFAEFGMPPRPGTIEIYDRGGDRNEVRNLYPRDDSYRRLRAVIDSIKKRIDRNLKRRGRGPAAGIDEELRRQMKALGYL